MNRKALVVPLPTAAVMLGSVHIGTIGKWAREGKVERVRLGRRSMITVASIENFVRRARVAAAARGREAKPAELVRAGNRPRKGSRKVKSPELTPAL
jgi:hypothetical protein